MPRFSGPSTTTLGAPKATSTSRSLQRARGGADVREALNNLRRALAIESQYLPAFNQMALLYLDLAQTADNEQMLDLAAVVCRQAQLIDRNYAPIYNTWGLVFVKKNDIIQALRMFEQATHLDNNMFEAYMNFGQITLGFRGYEDAKNAFSRAVELRGNDYDAHIGLGAALRGLNQMPQAQAEYEHAIQLDGARPEAYFNLGLLYQDYMSGSIDDLRPGQASTTSSSCPRSATTNVSRTRSRRCGATAASSRAAGTGGRGGARTTAARAGSRTSTRPSTPFGRLPQCSNRPRAAAAAPETRSIPGNLGLAPVSERQSAVRAPLTSIISAG